MRFLWVLAVLLWLGACDLEQVTRPDEDPIKLREEAERAYGTNDMPLAEKDFKLLTGSVPKDAEPWFRLGNIYARSNRADEAIHAYREAVVRKSSLTKAWYNMSLVQLNQAKKTLLEMQQYIGPDDPIAQQVQHMQETLDALLKPAAGQEDTRETPPH